MPSNQELVEKRNKIIVPETVVLAGVNILALVAVMKGLEVGVTHVAILNVLTALIFRYIDIVTNQTQAKEPLAFTTFFILANIIGSQLDFRDQVSDGIEILGLTGMNIALLILRTGAIMDAMIPGLVKKSQNKTK